LEALHAKIVEDFFEDKLVVEFPQEILGEIIIVGWRIVKNHPKPLPKIVPYPLVVVPMDRKPLASKVKRLIYMWVNE
jgi:hypothetical protein